jgi:hypothetical protein
MSQQTVSASTAQQMQTVAMQLDCACSSIANAAITAEESQAYMLLVPCNSGRETQVSPAKVTQLQHRTRSYPRYPKEAIV